MRTTAGGFDEVVFHSSDAARLAESFVAVGGFVHEHSGEADATLATIWDLPRGTRIRETALRHPVESRGRLRIVAIEGLSAQPIRSNGMPWDTGGILDAYFFVDDVDRVHAQLRERGWQAYNDVVEYAVGELRLRECIMRDRDGVVLCLMQRIVASAASTQAAPTKPHAVPGAAARAAFSAPFNLALPVRWDEFEAHRRWFLETLGWQSTLEGALASAPPGDSPTGLPRNLARTRRRRYAGFMRRTGANASGSLQLLAFEDIEGRDFSAHARPPNLGLLAARCEVEDVDALLAELEARRVKIVGAPATLDLPPYGRVRLGAIETPSGARLEFRSA